MRTLGALRSAFAYFSIAPVGTTVAPTGAAIAWLPFVGALIGAGTGCVAEAIGIYSTHALSVATAFGLTVVLSGAIHLDGFLDGCDAFFASVPIARRLEILKDPRHGTFALAGLAVVAGAWFAALWSMDGAVYPAALACAAASARWGAIVHARYISHASTTMATLRTRPPLGILALGFVLIGALGWSLGRRGVVATLAACAAAALSVTWVRGRLGGVIVGDGYGFAIVVAEVSALVAIAA